MTKRKNLLCNQFFFKQNIARDGENERNVYERIT